MTMLAEYGTLSLEDVLGPSIEMAEGYAIEASAANSMERNKRRIKDWKYSSEVYLPHAGQEREAPSAGEIFRQVDLAATLRRLVEAEREALAAGKSRKEAIYAAYDRFYRGDIAEEFVRGAREEGALITMEDLDNWQVYIEEPVMTTYKDIEVYKLTTWVQGPVLLQALNILENFDLKSMGFNSTRYIHTLYQAMNLAFADRDFYYGDPYYPPEEPVEGLLSKDYAKERAKLIDWEKNDPNIGPGDPYPFQGGQNPYQRYLDTWESRWPPTTDATGDQALREIEESFYLGTTSIQAADEEGWVVSVTPSGAWIPAVIAGNTGVGISQRGQSFVLDPAENPYNQAVPVVRDPGRRHPGPEQPAVLPERRRVWHERAAGRRGGQHQQLPDAELVPQPRVDPRSPAAARIGAAVGTGGAVRHGVQPYVPSANLRANERGLLRLGTGLFLGRVQQLRGGLRDRVVIGPLGQHGQRGER
jgi:gamma-glutamyltranspeptidase/glutathione hydrolase